MTQTQRSPNNSIERRSLLLTLCSLALLGVLAQPTFAQNSGKGEDKVLFTDDQFEIHITYFKSSLAREAPVVICVHDLKGDRLVWHNGLAEILNQAGYAVVTVDLRYHGQSTKQGGQDAAAPKGGISKGDYALMISQDMDAVKQFLYDEHQDGNLNMRKTAIIAAGDSASIAVNFATLDWLKKPHPDAPTLASRTPRGQDIQAIVLLSPKSSSSGFSCLSPLRDVLRDPAKAISFLFCYGTKDRDRDRRTDAKKLFNIAQVNAKNPAEGEVGRVLLQDYPYNLGGTDLLNKQIKTEDHITIFLEKRLLKLDGEQYEWRDRKSRL